MKVGQIVLYRINGVDKQTGDTHQNYDGEQVPAIVTKIWPGEFDSGKTPGYNITVFPDGNSTMWRTSVREGDGPGQISEDK
jgi:hypothetical protein